MPVYRFRAAIGGEHKGHGDGGAPMRERTSDVEDR